MYEEVISNLSGEVIHRINLYVYDICSRAIITDFTATYLTTDVDRTQQYYLLLKFIRMMYFPVEKTIVPGSGEYAEKISWFIDFFIAPLVPRIKSNSRNSTHIFNILNGMTDLPTNSILCMLDVNSLFTNITHYSAI